MDTRKNLKDVVALHFPWHKRALTSEELAQTEAFFIPGRGEQKTHGILLLHGFTGTPAVWLGLAKALAARGYTITCPILAGHAHQSADLITTHWKDWLQSADQALMDLQAQCQEITIIGHSLGAMLALQLATRHPTIQQLFLVSPAVYPTFYFTWAVKINLDVFLKKLGCQFLPPVGGNLKKKDAWEFNYPRTAINALIQLYACMRDTQQRLSQVKIPLTIFQSPRDLLVPANSMKTLVAALGSTEKEVVWLKNSYHVIPLDNDAETLIEKILQRL